MLIDQHIQKRKKIQNLAYIENGRKFKTLLENYAIFIRRKVKCDPKRKEYVCGSGARIEGVPDCF